mmetsp:Transcript_15276/g.48691  ORF Transcript_15276/g.48691 Transcript_15276/m.48691 type:complete len:88 (+) Transcript_15276:241-504(+)
MHAKLTRGTALQQTNDFFQQYGILAAFFGCLVLPIHPFVMVGAFSGLSQSALASAVFVARVLRNGLVCYLAASGNSVKAYFSNAKEE